MTSWDRFGDALERSDVLGNALGTLRNRVNGGLGAAETRKIQCSGVPTQENHRKIRRFDLWEALGPLWGRSGNALGTPWEPFGNTPSRNRKTSYFTWSGASRAAKPLCFTWLSLKHRILRALERSEPPKHCILRCFVNAEENVAKREAT